MIDEIKAMLEPKEEEMSTDSEVPSVKSEETTTKTVYAEKEELSQVEKVTHNPEAETKTNLNLFAQKRSKTTADLVLERISNIKNKK